MTKHTASRDVRLGIVGTLVAVLTVLTALSGSALDLLFSSDTYRADFAEAGGLVAGDDVIISGVTVGEVNGVELVGDRVQVSFRLTDKAPELGDLTRAEVISRTALGKKALVLVPEGDAELAPEDTIPVSRTTPAFDVTEALSQLTATIQPIETGRLSDSLDVVSEVLRQAAPEVRPALEGITRLSDALSSRDKQLGNLLRDSASLTTLLAGRDRQVQELFGDGAQLLGALNQQSKALDELFENITAMSSQLTGLVKDNEQQIRPALRELNAVLAILRKNRANIDHALAAASPLMRELGEVVAAFPGFNVYVPNLAMTNLAPGAPSLLLGEDQ